MGFECLNNAEHLDDIWGGKYCKIFQKFYTYLEQWKENVWTFGQTLTNIYPIVWYSTVIDKAGGFMALKNKHVHAQSCPTLCNSMDCSLPGSSVLGIFQARIPECVAISYSSGYSQPRNWTLSLKSPALAGGFLSTAPSGKQLICSMLKKKKTNLCFEGHSCKAQLCKVPHYEEIYIRLPANWKIISSAYWSLT